ncbi:MAPEG family protein [Roseibium album]|nr:MAPEG family protein [Roseibium album]
MPYSGNVHPFNSHWFKAFQIPIFEAGISRCADGKIAEEGSQITEAENDARKQRVRLIVIGYPFALVAICLALNIAVLGVQPLEIGLPSKQVIAALVVAGILLLVNHTWLMTTTELTRVRFGLHATPEEWAASDKKREEASSEGLEELGRHHNAHRNTTENTVYFILLALLFALASPSNLATYLWIVGFAVARLGYTFAYLAGKDGQRGLFMSLGLISLYGLASYLAIALII